MPDVNETSAAEVDLELTIHCGKELVVPIGGLTILIRATDAETPTDHSSPAVTPRKVVVRTNQGPGNVSYLDVKGLADRVATLDVDPHVKTRGVTLDDLGSLHVRHRDVDLAEIDELTSEPT